MTRGRWHGSPKCIGWANACSTWARCSCVATLTSGAWLSVLFLIPLHCTNQDLLAHHADLSLVYSLHPLKCCIYLVCFNLICIRFKGIPILSRFPLAPLINLKSYFDFSKTYIFYYQYAQSYCSLSIFRYIFFRFCFGFTCKW